MGVHAIKNPLDLWIYQELIYETKPDYIIETGTNLGGSALFLANLCDLIDHGEVISIDLNELRDDYPAHERITYIGGLSSVDPAVRACLPAQGQSKCMVILDSDHAQKHVAAELDFYAPYVSSGCYLIVEDTSVNGHPLLPEHGPGPWEAVEDFMFSDLGQEFQIDVRCHKFLFTLHPNGFLRRR